MTEKATRIADVVILGGGVIGASIAHHLAQKDVGKILLIDRAGDHASTARATGGFRAQFGSAVNVRLSMLAREKLLRFEEETGVDPGFAQHGYLFLARTPQTLDALREAQTIQHESGASESRMIDAGEVHAINPAIDDDAILGAAFSPLDGFIKPLEILRGYCTSAVRAGVEVVQCEERGLRTHAGKITTVETSDGDIEAGIVINAKGAWAGAPVVPVRRQVATTVPTDVLPSNMPMTIWADDGFHLRVRDGRVLLLQPHEVAPGFDDAFDDAWLPSVVKLAHERVPCLRDVPIDRERCWAGLYEISPDRHALLGQAPGIDNLYLAIGSSGHGVMHSPALGQLLAELIVDGKTSIDIHALRPSRFDEGDPVRGSELL